MATISSLLVKIGVLADHQEVGKFSQSLRGMAQVTKKSAAMLSLLGGAAQTAIGGLGFFMKKSLDNLDDLKQLAAVTGLNARAIQELGAIATVNGSSMEATKGTVERLSQTIGEAADGIGRGAMAFKEYGLSARASDGHVKNALEIMDELRLKMQGLSQVQQIAMLNKLGIDPSMIQTLRLSNHELEKAKKTYHALTLGTATKENIQTAAAFKDSLSDVWIFIKAISEYISLQLAPSVISVVDRIKAWISTNQALIKNGLQQAAEVIKSIVKFCFDMGAAIANVVNHTIGWKAALIALSAILIAINLILSANPVFLIAAAISAAILGIIWLLNDLFNYMDGKKSKLGDFWKPFVHAIKAVKAFWLDIKPTVVSVLSYIWSIIQRFASAFYGVFKGIASVFGGVFETLSGLFTGNIDKIKAGLSDLLDGFVSIGSSIMGFWNSIGNDIADFFSSIWNSIKSKFDWAVKLLNKLPGVNIDIGSSGQDKLSDQSLNAITAGLPNANPNSLGARVSSATQNIVNNTTVNTTINATDTKAGATKAAERYNRVIQNNASPIR